MNIPNGFRKEIIACIKISSELKKLNIQDSDNIFNFISIEPFRPEKLNTWFCNLLRELNILNLPKKQTTYSVETIRNSAIVELILAGFDLALLSKISGISISSLERKYYKVKSYNSNQINELINKGISGLPYYSYI